MQAQQRAAPATVKAVDHKKKKLSKVGSDLERLPPGDPGILYLLLASNSWSGRKQSQ